MYQSSFRALRHIHLVCLCFIQVDPLGRYLIIDELVNVVDILLHRAAGVACVRVPVFGRCFEAGIDVTRGALAAY